MTTAISCRNFNCRHAIHGRCSLDHVVFDYISVDCDYGDVYTQRCEMEETLTPEQQQRLMNKRRKAIEKFRNNRGVGNDNSVN